MTTPENTMMPFGKYKGKVLSEILRDDPAYLDWLSDADIQSPALRAAVAHMCKKYAAEIERAVGDD